MGLRDQIHKTEKGISLAAQRQINHGRKEWADAERRLRQKMRIYRDESVSYDSADVEDQMSKTADLRPPAGGHAGEQLLEPEARAIVSIRGRDVNLDADDDECGHLIQSR